jgi:RHS repeat-associated protein
MVAVNYDWDELEDNIDEEYDDAGVTVAEYTTELGRFGNVISQRRTGQSSFLHCDGIGSTLALTTLVGAVTDTNAYNAFGEVIEQAGNTNNPFQYVGQKQYYRDEQTGDYSVRRRPLYPAGGRWLTFDPIALNDAFLHQYVYSLNSPLTYYDPSGLQEDFCGAAPKTCCCCAEKLEIEKSKKYSGGNRFGWQFEVAIEMTWKEHTRHEDCTLQWWEHMTIVEPLSRDKPGVWIPRHKPATVGGRVTPTLDPWFNTRAKRKKLCPGPEKLPPPRMRDTPSLPTGDWTPDFPLGVQDLFIAIRVKSGEGCKDDGVCTHEFRDKYIHIHLETVRRTIRKKERVIGKEPRSGDIVDPLPTPPGNPPWD